MAGREGREAKSRQFSDRRLAGVYDVINPLGRDSEFWCREVERLGPERIIDFGCGTGLLTCELAARGYRMIGIDPAGPMIDVARRKECSGDLRWIEGGYEKLDGLRADLVLLTSHVAQFLIDDREWREFLAAAHGALRPGGHLLFDSRNPAVDAFATWPSENNRRSAIGPDGEQIEYWCNLLEPPDPIARYELHYLFVESGEAIVSTDAIIFRSREEIEESLSNAGFAVEKVYGWWDGREMGEGDGEMVVVGSRGTNNGEKETQ